MKSLRLAFIGGGNMASCLIGGLIADHVRPDNITVADHNAATLKQLRSRFGVNTEADNGAAIKHADVVVLAVKPQVLKSVAEELAALVQQQRPLIVSVAAGITSADLSRWLGDNVAVVRAMPNTPALVNSGATGLFANAQVSDVQRDTAESILRAVGLVVWVDNELQMDTVTALSGSGPAYFFRIMESLQAAAVKLGLSEETAQLLTLQTALGAAKMALESEDSVSRLREKVTSPGGTTEQGLGIMEQENIDDLLYLVLKAAQERSRELATLLGKD